MFLNMSIKRASSDVQPAAFITTYYTIFMLPVFLLSTLSYHIHNPFMFLGSDQECRNSFAGVIFEDENQDGAFGPSEQPLPGYVTLHSEINANTEAFETETGYFLPRNIICGIYEVCHQQVLVGHITVGEVMPASLYTFPAKKLDPMRLNICLPYTVYLPYISR